MIGSRLEQLDWRQGSVVHPSDVRPLIKMIGGITFSENLVLIVASQSCDIANNQLATEPYIEFSIARRIERLDGNLTHGKNPRVLHTHLFMSYKEGVGNFEQDHIELKAYEKVLLSREKLVEFRPDPNKVLEERHLKSYVTWLAARYSRPALPSEFNERIRRSAKGRLRSRAKKVSEKILGIYVQISPDREINQDEDYDVNLLGLLSADSQKYSAEAQDEVNQIAEVIRGANMEVAATVQTENEVSMGMIKLYRRLYFDDLSLQDETPLPPETRNIF